MTAGPNRVYNDGRGAIVPFDDSNLGTWAYQENEHGMASDLLPGDFFNFSTFDLSFFDLSLIPIDLLPVDTNLNGELDFEGDDGDLAKFVEYLDNIGNVDNNNPADPLIHWVANASFHFADLIRGPFDPGNPNIQFSEMKDNEVDILDIDPFLVMHCVVEHPTCSGSSMPVPEPNAQVSSIIGLLCLLCLRRHVGKRQS
jgi:hypothetical protein